MKIRQLSIIYKANFFVVFVFLSLIAINVWETWNARATQLAEAKTATLNLARALTEQADSTIKIADTVLVGLVERLEYDLPDTANLDRVHKLLKLRAAELPLLQRISFIDAKGSLQVTSLQNAIKNIDNSAREYFIFHRDHPDRGPHIGPPFRARSDGTWIITVSRRINRADGSFGGIALASIDTAYFNKFYASVDVGRLGAITLASTDATLLARYPFDEKLIGKNIAGSVLFHDLLPKSPRGSTMVKSSIDGVERLYSYQTSDSYPLVVVAALSKDEILSEWQKMFYRHFAGVTLLGIVISFLGYRLIKQITLRVQSERELLQAQASMKLLNQELEKMASQDGLTGLVNRRQFDISLENEFNRAIRYGHKLSVLMIDVDHFKQFNDLYGHLAGDECLRAISGTFRSHVKRPGDIVARYGGEEFIVLLHDADEKGAAKIAANILASVIGLNIAHTDSTFGIVTISCGVHTISPVKGDGNTPLKTIGSADKQLYIAKTKGRNRVAQTGENDG
jgi:diguanylate cyclase (GGDEF)-like protein